MAAQQSASTSTRCVRHHQDSSLCGTPDLTRLGKVTRFEAHSADGIWIYLRDTQFRAAWHVEHVPTGRNVMFAAPSLKSARAGTADGAFDALLGLNVAVAA